MTYGEAFTVQPFGNIMQTLTLTGAQLGRLLEQQWQPSATRILQVSSTLHYTWSPSAPVGGQGLRITRRRRPGRPRGDATGCR